MKNTKSPTNFAQPDKKKVSKKINKNKKNIPNYKPFTREKPFEYSSDSELDGIESELEEQFETLKDANDTDSPSPKTPQLIQRNKSKSQRKSRKKNYLNKFDDGFKSEGSDEDNWINNKDNKKENKEGTSSPSWSIKIPSSTSNQTTPNMKFNAELNKDKVKGYLSKQDFKSFIKNVK